MVIGVDAREICDRPAGKGQYLLRILICWVQDPTCYLVLYTYPDQKLPEVVRGERVRQVILAGHAFLWHRAVARHLSKDSVDVFFAALSYQSSLWNKIPTVTVAHDLAIFRLPKLVHNRRAWLVERLTLRRAVQASALLIAVSQSTRCDLIELMGADDNRIRVIGEAPLLATGLPLPRQARKPYFLFTGTLEPRKNIGNLLKAYAGLSEEIRSTYRLKLAGKPGWGKQDYPALAKELGIADRVDFLGYVSDSTLLCLYREASLFIYPSWYEGFGLPVIEAMAVGTPVLTSSVSSLPELVGPEGLTYDPADVAALVQGIEDLINNPEHYQYQSKMLSERASSYSWEVIATQILQVFQSLV